MPLPTMCHRASRLFAPLSQHEPSNNCKSFCRATFCGLLSRNDPQKGARAFVEVLTNAVCHTAKWLKSTLERLSEKGVSDALSVDLAGIRRPKWAEKHCLGCP